MIKLEQKQLLNFLKKEKKNINFQKKIRILILIMSLIQ